MCVRCDEIKWNISNEKKIIDYKNENILCQVKLFESFNELGENNIKLLNEMLDGL